MKRICYVCCIILVLFLLSAGVAANSDTQKETSNVIGNSSAESEPQPEEARIMYGVMHLM